MAQVTPVDFALSAVVLVGVALTVFMRSRKGEVMAFLGLGVVLSLVWFRLTSLDIGLAEAALGSGILSAVLVVLAASTNSQAAETRQQAMQFKAAPRWLTGLLGGICGVVITTVVAGIWWRTEHVLPQWETALDPAMRQLPVDHGITGVLLAFRAYDTLLESAVLMFAALLALTLMPDNSLRSATRSRANLLHQAQAASFSWVFRLMTPLLFLVGLWLLFAGTTEAGGAFQSGAVIAGMLILLHLAGVQLDHFIRYWLTPLAIAGVSVFVLAGLLGPLSGEAWFTWPSAFAYGAILSVEITLTAGIAAALFMLYLAMLPPLGNVLDNPGEPVHQEAKP
ncbi:MnhB domain-containing protein [Yaniella halotolerans]|uniref:MnhB domain-containing protein n=1 Tax=Yaniella halotolerans TaxID=225453 RepID=UPI0003B72D4E|nr:MnhB domain-containing protein [Yaniella halotolerans]